VLDGLGVVLERTRSAHDFGGAGEETGLGVSADTTGDISDVAGTEVADERLACSELDSSCGVGEVEDTTLTDSRCACRDVLGLIGMIGTAGMTGTAGRLVRCGGLDVG
jgi:hypothetical protein